MREEIFITGIGGQGIALAGEILAKTAMHNNMYAVVTKFYGAEVRGGAASSGIIISDKKIYFQFVRNLDFLIALHEKGLREHAPKKTKHLVIEEDMIKNHTVSAEKIIKIPAIRIAEGIGSSLLANMVMLGAYAKLSDVLPIQALVETVKKESPRKYLELNIRAILEGYRFIEHIGI
ncbi:MAG: 2-oxoacid:acceptor oxidoreductase family protein [Candidatus Korarchaeota archaeon]|nr:2-oxoacid:acceptor oxidoreductase family protein [Candidatus Korarchaeota archaeon]